MREVSISLSIILFLSIFGCLISTGEPISTDDISEEVNPYFNEVGTGFWGQSLGNFGDYIVSCERHSVGLYDSKITVRNLSGGVLWEKDLSCEDTKISESGNEFLALNKIKNFTTHEYTAYILGFYNTNSSNPVWEYVIQCPELNCNGAPKIGISGDGEFAAFANVSGLHYFSRESNTPLWVSAPFSQYQIREVNNFGRSTSSSTDGYQGVEFSEYGRVVVSTGSAIHLFENDSNIPAWSKDYFQTNHFPTVNLAKISLNGEHIGYVSGIPNNDQNGTEYLEEHHILLLSNGTEYYNYSSETVFLDPQANGFFSDHRGQVDLSSNGSSAIFVGNDFDERKTLHFVSDYGLSHYTSQFEDFIGDTGAPRPNYDSFTVASLADNGESVFVGLRSGKYLLLLNKTLVPLKKFSPIIGTHSALEEYTLQDIMWSKFDSIQTSRQGSLVSISGGYKFVDSTSGGDKVVSATWIYLTSIDDSDVDYDGWLDFEELDCGFNPTDVTSSPTDMDNDSICDSLDDDDDNDGYADSEDYFPFDPTEWVDTDFDDIGDNSDLDDDGDGWFDDVEDICLTDRLNHLSYPTDTDLDDICDNLDDDDDGDGVLDVDDLFPLDGTEITDFDMDGIGDNSDLDDDNDGWSDSQEISCDSDPRDSLNLPNDLDNDWICDSNDLDKDGDGYIDQVELNCGSDHLDVSSFPPDFDEDGTCDILDFDYDGDNVTKPEDRGDNVQDVLGCTDSNADNYDYNATKDDGSCRYDMSPLQFIAVVCGTCVTIWAVIYAIYLPFKLWGDRGARKKGYRNWKHQMEVEEQREKQEEARKEREKQLEERQRKEAILKRNRAKLPSLREELEEYAKFIFPSLTKFKIDPVDEKLFISYPVGKRTRKLYYSSVFTRRSESIKQEIAKDYGAESEYIRKMESKEAERKDWLFDGRSCEIGTGFWGSGSCLNNAKRICPRCKKFICNTHTSNKSFGGSVGKSMCTTCASVLSDV